MSRVLTYPSFLRTRQGGFLPTNTVLVDGALRARLVPADRRRFDRIFKGMPAERIEQLRTRLAPVAAA